MAVIIDSYSETNGDAAVLFSANFNYRGQSFNSGTGVILDRCVFSLYKDNNPTGNIYAKLYAHSGTYGASSVPTGAALATSDPIDASTLTATETLTTFQFSGANRYHLTTGTPYVMIIFHAGDDTNYIKALVDASSPAHGGNGCYSADGSSWSTHTAIDFVFYVYAEESSPSASPSVSPSQSPSSSSSPSSSMSPSVSPSYSPSVSVSPSDSPSISPSSSVSLSVSPSVSPSMSPSPSPTDWTDRSGISSAWVHRTQAIHTIVIDVNP